jgi:hypothetical protein
MKMTGDGYLGIIFSKTFRSKTDATSPELDSRSIGFATQEFAIFLESLYGYRVAGLPRSVRKSKYVSVALSFCADFTQLYFLLRLVLETDMLAIR